MHCSTPNRGLTFFTVAIVALLGIGTVVLSQENGDQTDNQSKTPIEETAAKNNVASVPDKKTGSAGILESDKESHDFGQIPIFGGTVSTTFTLKNSGDEPLAISHVTTSCMCTKASIDGITFGMHLNQPVNIVVQPGEEKIMPVVFDPMAHGPDATGPITRIITVETDSATTPKLEIKVSGDVTKP